jgi:Ca2+-binding EF-hand superfamily protein
MSYFLVLDNLKQTMRSRGAREFRGIARRFRIFADGDGYIDRAEFADGLMEMGLDFSNEHIDALLGFFDKNGDGKISLDEFLVGLRGQLNTKRQSVVDKAFLAFDKTCDGVVDAEDLKVSFNVDKHPKF